MKKDNVYAYTLLGLSVTVLLISLLTMHYLFSGSKTRLLQAQFESSRREAREIGKLLERQLQSGVAKESVVSSLQQSIENTDIQSGFICMYDTAGKEICHPDPSRIGQIIGKENSVVEDLTGEGSLSFYQLLNQGQAKGGLRKFGQSSRGSEIIYAYPVSNTPWMVAAHANLQALQGQVTDMRNHFLLVHALSGTLIVMLSFAVVRWIGNGYEKRLEWEKDQLIEEVKSLARLNADLVSYRTKVEDQLTTGGPIESEAAPARRRMLTYWKDQLIYLEVEQIAFFYTQQSQTHIYCLDERVYESNDSLDELHKHLDATQFFRANRQFIISIRAIDKIFQYGKHQLKIAVHPQAPEDILISKNKVAEFKQWLNS